MRSFFPNPWGADHGDWAPFLLHEFFGPPTLLHYLARRLRFWTWAHVLWHRLDPSVGRAILMGLCPDSLHKAEVWACVLGLRSGPAHVLLFAPSKC